MNPTGTKILIVEDETFIADLYSHVLTKAGYTIKTANDGQTALNALQQEQFNLMLLDIMMPGMNGLEVLRQWKVKNPQSQMIVILLTNLGQDSVIKEGFDLGAQGYLIKSSMTPEQVAVEVGNALKNISAQSAPTMATPPPPATATPPTPAILTSTPTTPAPPLQPTAPVSPMANPPVSTAPTPIQPPTPILTPAPAENPTPTSSVPDPTKNT